MRHDLAPTAMDTSSSRGHYGMPSLNPAQDRFFFSNGAERLPEMRHHRQQPMAGRYVAGDEHAYDFDTKDSTKTPVFWAAMSELFNLSSTAMASVTDDGEPRLTANDTDAWDRARVSADWKQIVTIGILAFITLATIVGNVLVILSVFTYKPLRMVQNFFIVSLAAADLTVALLVLPLNMAYLMLDKWIFGVYVCEMWLTCDVLCCTASILNLCAIALDRYWAITDPINYQQKRTLKRVCWMIAGVWVLSVIICAPPLIGWNDWPDNFDENTKCALTQEKGYIIYSSSGSFFIPLIIMTVVYLKIYLAMRKRLRMRAKANQLPSAAAIPMTTCSTQERVGNGESSERRHSSFDGGPGEDGAGNHPALLAAARKMAGHAVTVTIGADGKRVNPVYHFVEQKQKISLSKERKAARTLGIIMGVFVVCWLPFFLMYVICPFVNVEPNNALAQFITWLGYVNSGLNPVIYTIFNEEFRKAFSKLLRCKCK